MKKLESLIKSMVLLISTIVFSKPALCCEDEYNKWQRWMRKAEGWGQTSEATAKVGMVGGSFLGPAGGLLGLVGAGPGAVSYRYKRLAEGAEKGYRECIERLEEQRRNDYQAAREAARQNEENALRAAEQTRIAREEACRAEEQARMADELVKRNDRQLMDDEELIQNQTCQTLAIDE